MINGQYTPLNLNCLGQLLVNHGLAINATQQGYMGVSTSASTYTTKGTIYTQTPLGKLADVTALAYTKIGTDLQQATYNSLISLGSSSIPALGNCKPTTYTGTYTGTLTMYGFLRLIPYLANQEFHVNGSTSYSDFLSTFMSCDGYMKTTNTLISNYNSARTYLKSTYSTMNDLITSDITGVSLSTIYWGQDLIASGRAIDLTRISDFGLPSVLLSTLSENHALTPSLNTALLSAGFTANDISNILLGNVTTEQEKKLYGAFAVILGVDLKDICILLNCQTHSLNSLADLLDPKKLFPNSYMTLTFPKYNDTLGLPTNSKTYYRIYLGSEPDTGLTPTLGLRLKSILPWTIACACDAFSYSMMQIKNIQSMNIEKFSQVVTHLEPMTGLTASGTVNYPINPEIANAALTVLAKGSGTNGEYTTCDFFGAMTDLRYDFKTLKALLKSLNTSALQTVYNNMYTVLSGAGPYDTALAPYITSANSIIAGLATNNSVIAQNINTLYNKFGTLLTIEENARSQALPNLVDLTTSTRDIYSFIDSLPEFALQTQDYGPALVLESIADLNYLGGTSLIGSMREIRNSVRLGLAGGKLDSGVDTSPFILPRVTGTTARQNPIQGYTSNEDVADIPIVTGAATTPGSLAGSPEVRLIPPNLNVFNIGVRNSVLAPTQAIEEIIRCNCDCWDNL